MMIYIFTTEPNYDLMTVQIIVGINPAVILLKHISRCKNRKLFNSKLYKLSARTDFFMFIGTRNFVSLSRGGVHTKFYCSKQFPLSINTDTISTIKSSHHLRAGIISMTMVERLRFKHVGREPSHRSVDKHGGRDLDKYQRRTPINITFDFDKYRAWLIEACRN